MLQTQPVLQATESLRPRRRSCGCKHLWQVKRCSSVAAADFQLIKSKWTREQQRAGFPPAAANRVVMTGNNVDELIVRLSLRYAAFLSDECCRWPASALAELAHRLRSRARLLNISHRDDAVATPDLHLRLDASSSCHAWALADEGASTLTLPLQRYVCALMDRRSNHIHSRRLYLQLTPAGTKLQIEVRGSSSSLLPGTTCLQMATNQLLMPVLPVRYC